MNIAFILHFNYIWGNRVMSEKRNLENEMKHLEPGQKMLAVVKANAYGHGAVEVAKVADEVGAAGFCVAILDEALQLRHNDIVKPILAGNPLRPKTSSRFVIVTVSFAAPPAVLLKVTVAL